MGMRTPKDDSFCATLVSALALYFGPSYLVSVLYWYFTSYCCAVVMQYLFTCRCAQRAYAFSRRVGEVKS